MHALVRRSRPGACHAGSQAGAARRGMGGGGGMSRQHVAPPAAATSRGFLFDVWCGSPAEGWVEEAEALNQYEDMLRESKVIDRLRARQGFERPRDEFKRRRRERIQARKWERANSDWWRPPTYEDGCGLSLAAPFAESFLGTDSGAVGMPDDEEEGLFDVQALKAAAEGGHWLDTAQASAPAQAGGYLDAGGAGGGYAFSSDSWEGGYISEQPAAPQAAAGAGAGQQLWGAGAAAAPSTVPSADGWVVPSSPAQQPAPLPVAAAAMQQARVVHYPVGTSSAAEWSLTDWIPAAANALAPATAGAAAKPPAPPQPPAAEVAQPRAAPPSAEALMAGAAALLEAAAAAQLAATPGSHGQQAAAGAAAAEQEAAAAQQAAPKAPRRGSRRYQPRRRAPGPAGPGAEGPIFLDESPWGGGDGAQSGDAAGQRQADKARR